MTEGRRQKWANDPEFAERRAAELRAGRLEKPPWTERRIAEILTDLDYHFSQRKFMFGVECDLILWDIGVVIQADGCYWHECPQHGLGHHPERHETDRIKNERIEGQSRWIVKRYWGHEIAEDNFPDRIEEELLAV